MYSETTDAIGAIQSSDILALISVIVAAAAFLLSIYTFRETRRHNRITVNPILDDELVFNQYAPRIGLLIQNRGSGTAIINKWELLLDGKPYRDAGIDRWEDLTEELLPGEIVNYSYFKPGAALWPSQRMELFGLDSKPYSIERSDRIREALKRLTITVTYRSQYQDDQPRIYTFEGHKIFEKNFGVTD